MRMLPSSLLISLLVVEVEAKSLNEAMAKIKTVSYTHLRAHET